MSALSNTSVVGGNVILPASVVVRILREQRVLTQGQIATYSDVSQQMISEFERGSSSIHLEKLLAIAELLGVPIMWGEFQLCRDALIAEPQQKSVHSCVDNLYVPHQDVPERAAS